MSDCTPKQVWLLYNCLIIGFIYFWGVNGLEGDSRRKKGRILVWGQFWSPSTQRGVPDRWGKAFMGIIVYHRDFSILLQWSCIIQFSFFFCFFLIPRNLAIKNKECSTFYADYYSTLFHMKIINILVFVTFYLTFAPMIYFHTGPFFWRDLPSSTDLGACTKYLWVKADVPLAFRWTIF